MKKDSPTLVHLTSSLKIGGAESVLCSIIDHLDPTQFNHHVIYFHDGPYSERLRAKGITLHQVKGLISLYDPVFCLRLYRLIKKLNPSCIHALLTAGNIFGRIIGRLLHIPVVSAIHSNIDQDSSMRNLVDRVTSIFAQKIVVVSDEAAHALRSRNTWIPAERIQVIRNGVNADEVRARGMQFQKTRYDLGLGEEHFVIGSVGRFEPIKRYDLLLESFALVNNNFPLTRLVLIGMGSQEQYLRTKAQSLGVEQYVSFVIGENAQYYYSIFDCFVQASDREGISIALLEAMSFSLPCIVTNVSKHHSVLTSGIDGIVVPAGNMRHLADAITQIVLDEAKRISLGYNAQQTVRERFSLDTMISAYRTVFTAASALKSMGK
jgi:glycosyltransferase involved in cell wall biosynthesis